jgi:uncharacterized protein (DUF1015 family)
MQACRASFSPLFSLYQDSQRKIGPILYGAAQEEPVMSLPAEQSNLPDPDEAHRLWAVTNPEIRRELGELLSAQPIYIADGHHRYETALTYQQGRIHGQSLAGSGAFSYVMMELVEFSDPGLIVLPLHRLVRGILPSSLVNLVDRFRDFFDVEMVVPGIDGWELPVDSCLGVLGLQPDSLVVLKRRQDVALETMMPGSRSQTYREFGVSILNHIVFDGILSEAKDIEIAYTADPKEPQQQIGKANYQLAFLLHPPEMETIKAVADAEDRMPPKSTYFYPKLPAGLVINPLD